MACVAFLITGGCSLVFGSGDYQGGATHDAGREDAQMDANDHDASSPGCEGAACTIRASYVDDPNDALAGTAHVLIKSGEQATWNLQSGELVHGGGAEDEIIVPISEAQDPGAPSLAMFVIDTLVVEKNARLSFTGPNRAIAILASGDVLIEGTVDVGATDEAGGPGGAPSAVNAELDGLWKLSGAPGNFATGANGDLGAVVFTGGGGGSNGAEGGEGGNGKATGFGGLVEATADGPGAGEIFSAAWPGSLFGGGAGGVGYCSTSPAVRGGGGGGALQIVSQASIRLNSAAKILAGGAGGGTRDEANAASRCPSGVSGSGGGGGAGGTVVLEADAVVVKGGIFANGGGGAGGDAGGAGPGPGNDGGDSSAPATGSYGGTSSFNHRKSGKGGDGGAAATAAGTDGVDVNASSSALDAYPVAATGGGGGGAGRIVIRTRTGSFDDNDGAFSPAGELLVVEKVNTFTPE